MRVEMSPLEVFAGLGNLMLVIVIQIMITDRVFDQVRLINERNLRRP